MSSFRNPELVKKGEKMEGWRLWIRSDDLTSAVLMAHNRAISGQSDMKGREFWSEDVSVSVVKLNVRFGELMKARTERWASGFS